MRCLNCRFCVSLICLCRKSPQYDREVEQLGFCAAWEAML